MTTADRTAADALARHFAYQDGGWWEHLNDREQATYRARALDVMQVVGPIYQPAREEATPADAPLYMSNEEASAWADGFNSAYTPKEPTK